MSANIEIKKYLSEMMKSQQLLLEAPVVTPRPSRRSSLVSIMAERDRDEVQRRRDRDDELARNSLHGTIIDRRRSSGDSIPAIHSQRSAVSEDCGDELQQGNQHEKQQRQQEEFIRHHQQFQEEVGRRVRGLMKLSHRNGAAIEEARVELSILANDALPGIPVDERSRQVRIELESLQKIETRLNSIVSNCERNIQQLRSQKTNPGPDASKEHSWQWYRSFVEGLRRQELQLQLAQAQVLTARTRRRVVQNSGQQATTSRRGPSRGSSRMAKVLRGKQRKKPENLTDLLREKEKQLRDKGLILRQVPSTESRSIAQHPLDAFSSFETTTTAKRESIPCIRLESNVRAAQSVSPDKFMLGTQLEDESVSSNGRGGNRVGGGESQSLLSLDSALAASLAKQKRHKTRSSHELSESISRNRKTKQGQLRVKRQADVNLKQKSSVLRCQASAAGDSVARSFAMSKNRKVKRKLIAQDSRRCPPDKFSLPFIQPKGARGRSELKKHQKLLRRPPRPHHSQQQSVPPNNSFDEPMSSWNQFLLGLNGGAGAGGAAEKLLRQETHAQPQTQSDEEGHGCFTPAELKLAFEFVQGARSSVAGNISVSDFDRACRQVKKARQNHTAAKSVCNLVILLEDLVHRSGDSPAQWFDLYSKPGDSEVLTHAEFENAIRCTCDELGIYSFENEDDIAVLTRYFDPQDSGILRLAVVLVGFERAHKPINVTAAISKSGPVFFYLLECAHELQKRPQDVFRIISRHSTSIDFAQFCEGIDDLGMLVGPSADLLAEYGSLQMRRQADVSTALHDGQHRSVGGDSVKDNGVSSHRLVQYHMTHSELRDMNNYRYFLLQKDRDRASLETTARGHRASSPLRIPSYLFMNGAPSPISSKSNSHTDSQTKNDVKDISRLRQLEQQDEELKLSMQQTSDEMHKLSASLLSAQESRNVVEAVSLALQKEQAEKRQRRVQELEEQQALLRKALDDAASDMKRGLHVWDSACCTSSSRIRFSKRPHDPSVIEESASSSKTSTNFTPAPPRGRPGVGSSNFRNQRIKVAALRTPTSGVQILKDNARDFSP